MNSAFELPANPEPLTRHPKAARPGEPITLHHDVCFGCGDNAPRGLHLKTYAGEGFTTTAQMTVETWMQGGPGNIHGGVLTAAFDEVMGTTPLIAGIPVVTGHLEVDFRRPIPLGTVLTFDVELVAKERRKVFVQAVAHDGDPSEPMATASAILIEIDVRKHYPGAFA